MSTERKPIELLIQPDLSDLEARIQQLADRIDAIHQAVCGKVSGSYTPAQAAEFLQIGRKQVYELLAQGRITGVRIGANWRITPKALDEFIAQGGDEKRDPDERAPLAEASFPATTQRNLIVPAPAGRRQRKESSDAHSRT